MIKFCLTLLFALAAFPAFAQSMYDLPTQVVPVQRHAAVHKTAVVDTLDDYLVRGTNFYLLTADTLGYVLGTNSITAETGVHYDGLGATTVNELMVFFSHKTVMGGSADSLTARVYQTAADSVPDTLLSVAKVSVDDVEVSGFATFIPFANPGTATGDFMVSILHDPAQMDDTVAITSTDPLTGDGQGEQRTRQFGSSGWEAAWDRWYFGGNPYNADALIIPIVDFTVGVAAPGASGTFLEAPYPQPAGVQVHLPYHLANAGAHAIQIFDARGRRVKRSARMDKSTGPQVWTVETAELPAGQYYFVLTTADVRLGGKFFIQY
ncbi:MAG: T9SS type A sorting domain-containing protein [Bacteroidota bacterium]